MIWDALKGACEADLQTAALIVETAGVIVTVPDMSTCFDERGKLLYCDWGPLGNNLHYEIGVAAYNMR